MKYNKYGPGQQWNVINIALGKEWNIALAEMKYNKYRPG